jgi:hypothetical protein
VLDYLKLKNRSIVDLSFLQNKVFFKNFLLTFNNNIINTLPCNLFTKRTDAYFNIIGEYINFLSKKMFSNTKNWLQDLMKIFPILFNKIEYFSILKNKNISKYTDFAVSRLYRFIFSLNWSTAKKYF